jgi:hypothetical protein
MFADAEVIRRHDPALLEVPRPFKTELWRGFEEGFDRGARRFQRLTVECEADRHRGYDSPIVTAGPATSHYALSRFSTPTAARSSRVSVDS